MAIPQGWQPTYSEEQARRLFDRYKGRAHALPESKLTELKNHSEAYGIPFYEGDFSIVDAIGQAAAGFFEGFTTLDVMEHPDNEYEQIARNIGHLAGFAPGIMAGPAKFLFPKALAARNFAAKVSDLKSIPFMGADLIKDYGKKALKFSTKGNVVRSKAFDTTKNFLLGDKAKHILEGAFNLGAASGISAWRGGVDQMIAAATSGAQAGAVFRALGNLTPGTEMHQKLSRAVGGSLYMGLPSTQRGATTPEQVYEYLMGAYFGGKEVSWSRAGAHKALKKMRTKAKEDAEWAGRSGMDPELWEGYEKLPEEVKPKLVEEAKKAWGDPDMNREGYAAYELLKEMGLEGEITEKELVEQGFEKTDEYVDGDRVYKASPKLIQQKFKSFMTSGGAVGADTEFASAANKVGLTTINYTFGKHAGKVKATGFKRLLSPKELEEADSHIREANLKIGKNEPTKKGEEYIRNLQRRNWYQVKWADSVYAVGEFENPQKRTNIQGEEFIVKPKTLVKGGTGLTVQMAIDNGKPVYFFNQSQKQWYTWNQSLNKGDGMFTEIKEPPRPTNRFAGVGTRKLNKFGKKAIKDLFEKNWAPSTTATDKVAKTAKETTQKATLTKLRSQIVEKEKLYKELKDKVIVAKSQGMDTTTEELDLERVSLDNEQLIAKYNRIANRGIKLRTPSVLENKEQASTEIKQGLDFEVTVDNKVGKKSMQFVNTHLNKLIAGSPTVMEGQNTKLELANLTSEVLERANTDGSPKFLRRGSKENLSEEWANELETEIKDRYGDPEFQLTPEARRDMRQWMTMKNTGKLVTHLQSDGKRIMRMANDSAPISLSGNRKQQSEPIKRIEVTYLEEGGTDKEPTIMTLDHVTIQTKNGKRDINISEFKNKHLVKENKNDEIKAAKDYGEFLGNNMLNLANAKNGGYYAFSGSGDKDRIHWVKFHPQIEKKTSTQVELDLADVKKVMSSGFGKEYKAAKDKFVKEHGGFSKLKALHDKIWLSNLRYDIAMNGMEYTPENVKLLTTHPGFIKNASAYNKRLQVWMSNAWAGDSNFIKQKIKLNDKGNYNYIIVEDLPGKLKNKNIQKLVSLLNNETAEHVDGAILVSDAVLKRINQDFGLESLGQNKSFIVSPNKTKGALLGKYMMHSAGEKMSKMMEAEGIHMIMHETAAKQRGLRGYDKNKKSSLKTYDIVGDKLDIKGGEIFDDLSPEHIMGNFGVKGNKHMVGDQRIPKQMTQLLLNNAWKSINQKVIDEAFEEIVGKRWAGEDKYNSMLTKYLDLSKSGANRTDLLSLEQDIVNNLDRISIPEIVKAMKADYAPGLSEAIYNKILSVDKDMVMDKISEGEITEEQAEDYNYEVNEFNSITDRVIQNAVDWVAESGLNKNASSVYMHKFVRDFRVKAVQNFLLNTATKPKRNNSAAAFMRPYDKAMQSGLETNEFLNANNKEGINHKDDIFLLDNEFKALNVNLEFSKYSGHSKLKKTTLGNLWEMYESGKFTGKDLEYVEDVLEAATVRVPMDSLSGTQVLKFKGFTGRQGHGILLHGRTMKAEGGADLDGDKSFVFFGGKDGLSKELRNTYKSQKEEYYSGKGKDKVVGDNKDNPFREDLIKPFSEESRRLLNSKAFQYSPSERLRISRAAVDGRNMLGPAVVNKQVMSAAYNSIIAAGGEDALYFSRGFGKKRKSYKMEVITKDDLDSQNRQRQVARTQLGLASDPLDELGLKGYNTWFNSLWKEHFHTKQLYRKVKGKWIKSNDSIELTPWDMRGGILGNHFDINKAYWGRNWTEGRKLNMVEIMALGDAVELMPPKGLNSFLSKTGKMFSGLDWSDSIFGKIDKKSLIATYQLHKDRVESYDWMKRFLGKPTFKVDIGKYVLNSMKHNLHTPLGIFKTSRDLDLFQDAIKGTKFVKEVKDNPGDYIGKHDYHKANRRKMLSELQVLAEDFVINDMTDISSLKSISSVLETMVKNKDTGFREGDLNIHQSVESIHQYVEGLKARSYLMARDRRRSPVYEERLNWESSKDEKNWNSLLKMFYEQVGVTDPNARRRGIGDDITAEMDQAEINMSIMKFKESLTGGGAKLFDHLMLGSWNRGNLDKIDKFIGSVKKWDPATLDIVKGFRHEASKTSISRLGFNSEAISDVSIKEHLGSFIEQFKPREIPATKETLDEYTEKMSNHKTRVEEEGVDPELTRALMSTGYEGLKKGRVDSETKSLIAEIVTDLKTYNNKVGQNIGEIARFVVQKDLNAFNKQDFAVLRNYLQELRGGTWLQRMFSKKGPVELAKRHHHLFPQAVNRELMRDDLILMRKKGFFIDKYGAPREGMVSKPTHYIDIIQNWIGKMNDSAVNVSDRYIKSFNESMLFHSGLEESKSFWEIAIRKRETHPDFLNSIKEKDDGKSSSQKQSIINHYRHNLTESENKLNWAELKGKKFNVEVDGKRQDLTGEQIVDRINSDLTNLFKEMHTFIKGEPGALDEYRYSGIVRNRQHDYKKFIGHLQEHIAGTSGRWRKEGITDVPSYFGIDGLRRIARSLLLDTPGLTKEDRAAIAKEPVIGTGKTIFDGYFPHMFFDRATSKKVMKESLLKIFETPESEMTKEEKLSELKKLYYKNKALGGEWHFDELSDFELMDELIEGVKLTKKQRLNKIKFFNPDERTGSMKSRDINMHGYSIDPSSVESYIRGLSNTYHRQLSQMFSRVQMNNMYGQMRNKWGQEQATAWQKFMKLYVQDAVGNPSVIPDRYYEDPVMKIQGTPYAWFADNRVTERINKIRKALNLGDKKMPEELRDVDLNTVRHWSNLEAQYEMASLLAHPKTAIANIFGGALHTIESVGVKTFMRARSPEYLSKINPKWKTKKDIMDFVVSQGVLPEFLVYELGLQKAFQTTKGKSFLNDLKAKLARDPEMSKKTIMELGSKHGIKDKIMNAASKFMTSTEKPLRRDAFMAHYIHAWEKFGGAIKEYDHPFLIEMAKKGVKATQFLYNAPFRPAFARSALGKVVSRFQLWAWNSVRFRNDVKREARIHGFVPGTEAYDRYTRTKQLDLMVFSLANVYSYSLFESNLPQPWGWYQDFGDWIFGDEKERDKAFYGAYPSKVAPLQMITPPALRMLGPTFNAMLSDDWSRMSQYYLYTMLPFGRMIRDVNPWHKSNLIHNPMRVFEKIGGIPMMQTQRAITQWKDKTDEEGNVIEGDKPDTLYPGSYKR